MSDTNVYTATFTLTQEGLDGMVTPTLDFSPHVDPIDEAAPAIYEYMSTIALDFLKQVNILDEDNEILDESGFDRLELNLSSNRKTTH